MEQIKENKLGTKPIGALVLSMSAPIMISMLVQALYNIVDTIFISHYANIGPHSTVAYVNAISYAMPMQFLMTAVGVGTSIGMNSLLSMKLGQKDFKGANKSAGNGLSLMIISSAVFMLIGIFFTKYIISFQTTDSIILEMSTTYTSVLLICSTPLFIQVCFERILQATGNSIYSMVVQGVSALLNILFDAILIFGFWIIPEMGVLGAAIATILAQTIGACIAIIITKIKVREVKIKVKNFKLNKRVVKEIYQVGVPTVIMQSVASFMLMLMNFILKGSPLVYQSALGIYFKIQSFIFMPVFGLNSGLIPIVSYNYGAKNKERIIKAINKGVIYAFIIMAMGTIVLNVFAENLMAMFDANEELVRVGATAFRTISYSFLLAGIVISFSSAFQALRKAHYSMIISILRQIFLLVPIAFLIVKFIGVEYVWYAFLIAEIPAFFLGIMLMRKLRKRTIEPLDFSEEIAA